MKKYTCLAPAAGLLMAFFTTNASAVIINFIDLTQKAGGLGESSWSTLSASDHPDLNYFGISITGHALTTTGLSPDDDDLNQFAYLDWGTAGLGVCKDAVGAPSGANPNSGTNSCQPSSDDNVTDHEYLEFVFDQDVVVDNLWFNNNHDGGFDPADPATGELPDKVTIGVGAQSTDLDDGTPPFPGDVFGLALGYAGGANGIGSFTVKQGEKLWVAFNNEQFYISGMEISAVPVPAAVWLFGTAIAGLLGFQRRRKAA